MKNAAEGAVAVPTEGLADSFASIVSNLVSLIQQVQASIALIETAIDRESRACDQEISANVVVLDDVTPRYAKATAALSTCNANLGVALRFLQDTTTSGPKSSAAADRRLFADA
jgi:hypothetical protein